MKDILQQYDNTSPGLDGKAGLLQIVITFYEICIFTNNNLPGGYGITSKCVVFGSQWIDKKSLSEDDWYYFELHGYNINYI